jgi:hypothetical protein
MSSTGANIKAPSAQTLGAPPAIRSADKVTFLLKARLLEIGMARVSTTQKRLNALFSAAHSDDYAFLCD